MKLSKRHPLASIWAVASIVSAAVLVPTGARAFGAWRNVNTAEASLASLSRQVDELGRLHASVPGWISREKPGSGLAPKLSAVLAKSGLPTGALQSLTADTAVPILGGGNSQIPAKRQRAVITLAGVTLPQLGKLLSAWRTGVPAWTVTGIDLGLEGQTGNGAAGARAAAMGGDLPLRIVLAAETVFLDEPAQGDRK